MSFLDLLVFEVEQDFTSGGTQVQVVDQQPCLLLDWGYLPTRKDYQKMSKCRPGGTRRIYLVFEV